MKTRQLIFTAISFNLIVAVIMIVSMFGLDGLEFLVELPLNILVALIGLYSCGFYIEKKIENTIQRSPKYAAITGASALFLILATATFLGSSVGFIQEGILQSHQEYTIQNAIFDYYFKPFFWIFLMGFMPTLIVGIILGLFIKRNLKNKTATNSR